MSDLVPIPFASLLRRAWHEHHRQQSIFDLPERRFHRQAPDLDLSVAFGGSRAANPVGPAAGPHTQLAQNILLSWLAGARILELKTVQVNDRLTLSRPCIDMATVGYNTEWSQELTLDQSLREYVKASMLIDLVAASGLAGLHASDTVFDISVGYDLDGIRSDRIRRWLENMRRADALVGELREEIPAEFARWRDWPFRTEISRSITLSTFHGTPAGEIERIGEFLIGLGFHLIIKLNPPMLGRARLEALLHDTLGYDDIVVNRACYERNLEFDEAVAMMRRLRALGARGGVEVGIKCGNTLEVLNRGTFLKEPVQYLSGQPLHVLHLALVAQWRRAMGGALPVSFSAGVDALNVADCVASGLAAVTTCTDLLRPGGYGRLPRYLASLQDRMRALGARTIGELVLATGGGTGNLEAAVCRNTDELLARALADERYRAARNRKPPRKVGSQLWLWDCLDCDKCIPVCPNDANFEIEVEPFATEAPTIEAGPLGWEETGRHPYAVSKRYQFANFADACNDCGNCDVFCPEDGGPYVEKPRFFGTEAGWRQAAPAGGFALVHEAAATTLFGRFGGREFVLRHADGAPEAAFSAPGLVTTRVDWASGAVRAAATVAGVESATLDLSYYLAMRTLIEALRRPDRVNFVNIGLAG